MHYALPIGGVQIAKPIVLAQHKGNESVPDHGGGRRK
jgi:hypothetical protein